MELCRRGSLAAVLAGAAEATAGAPITMIHPGVARPSATSVLDSDSENMIRVGIRRLCPPSVDGMSFRPEDEVQVPT
jgi:hypothetical protein